MDEDPAYTMPEAAMTAAFERLEEAETALVDMVLWLQSTCISSLAPGTNFQRASVALNLLLGLDAAISSRTDLPEALEGAFTGTFEPLFLSFESRYPEVRELGLAMAQSYAWRRDVAAHQMLAVHAVNQGLALCQRARSREADAGAVFLAFAADYHRRQSLWLAQGVHVDNDGDGQWEAVDASDGRELLVVVLELVQGQLVAAEHDCVASSKDQPLHGLILALDRLLAGNTTQERLELSLELATRAVAVGLRLLTARLDNTAAIPDFAEMDMAVTNRLDESSATIASADHSYLSSFAWTVLRNSCLVLSTGARMALGQGSPTTLRVEAVSEIYTTLTKTMLSCRHRGVIESFAAALSAFAHAVTSSKQEALCVLPSRWLEQQLDQLADLDAWRQLSVTRRSAGLPYIIHSLVNEEAAKIRKKRVKLAATKLLAIAATPIATHADVTKDPPQVSCSVFKQTLPNRPVLQMHALHVLEALVRESALAKDIEPFLESCLLAAIAGFDSDLWVVRSACMRLFSNTMQRVSGVYSTHTSSSRIDTATFADRYSKASL